MGRQGNWGRTDRLNLSRVQARVQTDTQIAGEVGITAPVAVCDRGAPHRTTVEARGHRSRSEYLLELGLLHAPVPDEGPNDDGIRYCRGDQDFKRCNQRAILLGAVAVDHRRHSIARNCDKDNRHGKEEDKRDFASQGHGGQEDQRDWKSHKQEVCYNVASPHSDQVRITGTALGARVGHDLPVVVEGLTFHQSRDHYRNQGRCQKIVDKFENKLKRPSPDVLCQPLQKLTDGVFGRPDTTNRIRVSNSIHVERSGLKHLILQNSIEYPRGEYELTPDFPTSNV